MYVSAGGHNEQADNAFVTVWLQMGQNEKNQLNLDVFLLTETFFTA